MNDAYSPPEANIEGPTNTSGTGKNAELPDGIKGWSWAAFLTTWIWGVGNRTWIALLGLIPFISPIVMIVLGVKGREWAWRNKEWKSVEHFNEVQSRWNFWSILISVMFLLIYVLFAFAGV